MSGQPITVLMVNEYPDYIDANVWADGLKSRVPGLEFRLWPDAGRKDDIDIVLIEPGPITTKIRANSIPHFERWIDWEGSARAEQYETELAERLYGEKNGPDKFELPPKAVVKKLIHALESSRPRARYYVTTPTYLAGLMRRILPTRLLDRAMIR